MALHIKSTGIDFADFGGSPQSELINDYEQGLYSIAVTYQQHGGGSSAGDYANGRYSKIANQVFLGGFVSLNSTGNGQGYVYVGGFPYTCDDTAQYDYAAITFGYATGMASSAGYPMSANILRATNYSFVRRWDHAVGTTNINHSEFGTGHGIYHGHYWMDA